MKRSIMVELVETILRTEPLITANELIEKIEETGGMIPACSKRGKFEWDVEDNIDLYAEMAAYGKQRDGEQS